MSIKSFNEYIVENSKEVSFVFGRFNPPTIGHEKLFEEVKKQSRGGSYRIYASQSVDAKKNPLGFTEKIKFLRKMFPKHARSVMADKDVRNVLDVLVKLYDQGFTKVTLVAGSDRVKEFDILLNKYNGIKARHGFYNFEGAINVVSAGERDPDAEGATGMSASKMRAAAQQNDLNLFSKGLPSNYNPTELFNAVRKGMGLKESRSFRKHVELPPISETREDYIEGSLFNVGNLVRIKESGEIGEIIICGSNYLMVECDGIKSRQWLDSVELVEEGGAGDWGTDKGVNRYLKDTPFSSIVQSPHNSTVKANTTTKEEKKKKRSAHGDKMPDSFETDKRDSDDSTDAKRRAQFNKQKEMDDDNPRAYKDAPGDKKFRKSGKMKPSQYTTKYKQMYGDKEKELEKKDKKEENEMIGNLKIEDRFVNEKTGVRAAIQKKSDASGISYSILKKVFDRGVAAWKVGHKPGTTPAQWGLARVNSFITKGKTWQKYDSDLAKKARGG